MNSVPADSSPIVIHAISTLFGRLRAEPVDATAFKLLPHLLQNWSLGSSPVRKLYNRCFAQRCYLSAELVAKVVAVAVALDWHWKIDCQLLGIRSLTGQKHIARCR